MGLEFEICHGWTKTFVLGRRDNYSTVTIRRKSLANKMGLCSESVLQEEEECGRLVHHFHYISWPDHGTPDHPLPLLKFLRHCRRADDMQLPGQDPAGEDEKRIDRQINHFSSPLKYLNHCKRIAYRMRSSNCRKGNQPLTGR